MEYSFDRAPTMAPRSKAGFQRIVLVVFAMAIAWAATAHADDLLDRSVQFHISASPLSNALIEFSTQSGLQVAAADAQIAQLNSSGVNGTLPIRAALSMLLHGTGLTFSRVGAETIAIRAAPIVPPSGAPTRAGESGAANEIPAARSVTLDVNANTSPEVLDVTVTAARPPTDQELAGDSLRQFVVHHATVHYLNTGTTGNLAHWRGGLQSICPLTVGLDPGYNAFVSARLRAVASNVGAPVQADPQCKDNVRIVFTNDPQDVMEDVVKWASDYFGVRYPAMRRLMAFRKDHAIQGWYMTTRRHSSVLNTNLGFLPIYLQPLWPQVIATGLKDRGDMGGIGVVILVVDASKVHYAIGTLADYVTMLTLSVVQSPDHCDPLPSILDVMSSSCAGREKPTALTAGDLAFLKALYYRNTGIGSSPSRDDIEFSMMRAFKDH